MNIKSNLKSSKTSLVLISLSLFILSATIFSRLLFSAVKRRNSNNLQSKLIEEVPSKVVEDETDQEKSVLGEEIVNEKILPDNFPTTFPLFPEATITDIWTERGDKIDAISVVWESGSIAEDIFNYYRENFILYEWASEIILQEKGSYTISFQKKESEGFMGIVNDGKGGSIISVTLGIKLSKNSRAVDEETIFSW